MQHREELGRDSLRSRDDTMTKSVLLEQSGTTEGATPYECALHGWSQIQDLTVYPLIILLALLILVTNRNEHGQRGALDVQIPQSSVE